MPVTSNESDLMPEDPVMIPGMVRETRFPLALQGPILSVICWCVWGAMSSVAYVAIKETRQMATNEEVDVISKTPQLESKPLNIMSRETATLLEDPLEKMALEASALRLRPTAVTGTEETQGNTGSVRTVGTVGTLRMPWRVGLSGNVETARTVRMAGSAGITGSAGTADTEQWTTASKISSKTEATAIEEQRAPVFTRPGSSRTESWREASPTIASTTTTTESVPSKTETLRMVTLEVPATGKKIKNTTAQIVGAKVPTCGVKGQLRHVADCMILHTPFSDPSSEESFVSNSSKTNSFPVIVRCSLVNTVVVHLVVVGDDPYVKDTGNVDGSIRMSDTVHGVDNAQNGYTNEYNIENIKSEKRSREKEGNMKNINNGTNYEELIHDEFNITDEGFRRNIISQPSDDCFGCTANRNNAMWGKNKEHRKEMQVESEKREEKGSDTQDPSRIRCLALKDVRGAPGEQRWTISFAADAIVGVAEADQDCWERSRNKGCHLRVRLWAATWDLPYVRFNLSMENFWRCDVTPEPLRPTGLRAGRGTSRASWLLHLSSCASSLTSLALEDMDLGAGTLTLPVLPVLRTLLLEGVVFFSPNIFASIPALESLTLRSCLLNGIPAGISSMPHLRFLELDADQGYEFHERHEEFGRLVALEQIRLTDAPELTATTLRRLPALPRLTALDLSGSTGLRFPSNDSYDFFGKFPSLQELDLSYSMLHTLSPSFLRPSAAKSRLKVLRLSHNMFISLPPLQGWHIDLLDLSFNSLQAPVNLGALNSTVGFLNLSVNNIAAWNDSSVFHLPSENGSSERNMSWVSTVDLSSNDIVFLSEAMTSSLDVVTAVDLEGNKFDCADCGAKRWAQWVVSSSQVLSAYALTCSAPPAAVGRPLGEVTSGPDPCAPVNATLSMFVAAPLFAFCVLLAAATVVAAIRFRSEITYMVHLFRIRQSRKDDDGRNCIYDAFVCFSGRDRAWVMRVLVPLLETPPLRYRLCLHDRDFPLGSLIVDNIVNAIERSRRVVIVLSPHFVSSKWCQWELDMAHHRGFEGSASFLVLIQLGSLDRGSLPRHLRYLCDTRTFLEWPTSPTNATTQGTMTFPGALTEDARMRLKNALGTSLREQRALTGGHGTNQHGDDDDARTKNETKQLSLDIQAGNAVPTDIQSTAMVSRKIPIVINSVEDVELTNNKNELKETA